RKGLSSRGKRFPAGVVSSFAWSLAYLEGCDAAGQLVYGGDGQEAVAKVDDVDGEAAGIQRARYELPVGADDLRAGGRRQAAEYRPLQGFIENLQGRLFLDAELILADIRIGVAVRRQGGVEQDRTVQRASAKGRVE